MINKNCVILPDRMISTVLLLLLLLLCVKHHAHRNSKRRVYPLRCPRTRDHRREATLLLRLLVLQSGAAVAVVWAYARTQELCL